MKKSWCILLAILLLLSFAACGSDSQDHQPTEDMLKADLQNSLTEYRVENDRYPIPLKEIQITKSLTEEKTYTAEIKVAAESAYAEYEYIANVAYTLYDQGWAMDSCDWGYYGYEVVRYPGEDELTNLENSGVIQTLADPVLHGEKSYFYVTGMRTIDWSPYVIASSECSLIWHYYEKDDSWDFDREEDNNTQYELTTAFEEAWESTIINAQAVDNQFSVGDLEVVLDHVNLKEDKISILFESSGGHGVSLRINVTIFREPMSRNGSDYDMEILIGKTKGNVTDVTYRYHYVK